jgi:hypothetical protein
MERVDFVSFVYFIHNQSFSSFFVLKCFGTVKTADPTPLYIVYRGIPIL